MSILSKIKGLFKSPSPEPIRLADGSILCTAAQAEEQLKILNATHAARMDAIRHPKQPRYRWSPEAVKRLSAGKKAYWIARKAAEKHNDERAVRYFSSQSSAAKSRNIDWELSFEDWLHIWKSSGHWHQRGRKKGQYVMARKGDKGPYSITNVDIITQKQNHVDAAPWEYISPTTRTALHNKVRGTKIHNNGVIEGRFHPGHAPLGFKLGILRTPEYTATYGRPRGTTGMAWFNNGQNNRMYKPGKQEAGFVRGHLPTGKRKLK